MNDLLVLAKPEKGYVHERPKEIYILSAVLRSLFKDSERKFKIRKKHNLDVIGVKEGEKDTVDLHCNIRGMHTQQLVFPELKCFRAPCTTLRVRCGGQLAPNATAR